MLSRTLRRDLKTGSLELRELARRGPRPSYRFAPPVIQLKGSRLVHGSRPFEVSSRGPPIARHLVHLFGATGALLGRPWITLHHRCVFPNAVGIRPCGLIRRVCIRLACAIYDCIRRHKRFADNMVSDLGPELGSVDLDIALGYLRTAHARRPRIEGALREHYRTICSVR